MKEAYERKLAIGELPTVMLELPTEKDCIRIIPPRRKSYAEVKTSKDKNDLNDLLDLKTDINSDEELPPLFEPAEGDADAEALLLEEKEDEKQKLSLIPQFDKRYFNEMTKRVIMKNSETHSLQCDMKLKFKVAENFSNERFYYPHNLDFRGRAYPIPPNLNHLGMILLTRFILQMLIFFPITPFVSLFYHYILTY